MRVTGMPQLQHAHAGMHQSGFSEVGPRAATVVPVSLSPGATIINVVHIQTVIFPTRRANAPHHVGLVFHTV